MRHEQQAAGQTQDVRRGGPDLEIPDPPLSAEDRRRLRPFTRIYGVARFLPLSRYRDSEELERHVRELLKLKTLVDDNGHAVRLRIVAGRWLDYLSAGPDGVFGTGDDTAIGICYDERSAGEGR